MNLNQPSNPTPIDFLDITEKTQLITNSKSTKVPLSKIDFLKIGEDFWKQKDLQSAYNKGLFFGKGDATDVQFSDFMKKFKKLFENIIRDELQSKNQTFENFKDDLKTLDTLFNMIFHHLNINKIELKEEKYLAILHGFINSHIDSIYH